MRPIYINGEEVTENIFFTVRWLSDNSGKNKEATKKMLHNAGIKPVCKDAIYAFKSLEEAGMVSPRKQRRKTNEQETRPPEAVSVLLASKRGRPPKAKPEPEPDKPTKPKK